MEYSITTLLLFVLLLIYFRIADRYNIIDKPNHRSAHTEITLRGGGIIFPIAFLLCLASFYFVRQSETDTQQYLLFGFGFLTITTISFLDDILDLSSILRLIFHFISVTLLLFSIQAFKLFPIWLLPILYVFIIGVLNAYNFMDGINGMTGLYSLITFGTLLYVNQYVIVFTQRNFIIYPMLACFIFLFFNFRKKAKCFMGDVGSIGIGFWVITLLGLLIVKSGDVKYLLLLSVYGVEVVFTILERLRLKENILEAHRRHLYQLLSNEMKVSHLWVSAGYSLLQIIINVVLISLDVATWVLFLTLVLPTAAIYILLKKSLKQTIQER